jgi:hypothetical protein
MNKYLLIVVTLVLRIWIARADDTETEKEMFLERGFNWKHYENAQKLNLDLENYTIYRANKANSLKGAIFMGIGGVSCLSALVFFLSAVLIESYDNSIYGSYEDDSDFEPLENTKKFYIITGGVFTATGVGFIIGGAVKRTKVGKVFTKNGRLISLRPESDAFNDRYGMQLSLSF